MTFRARFLTLFSVAVLTGTGFLAWAAIQQTRQTYARFDDERDVTLSAQFQREFSQRGQEVSYAMQGLADAEATLRMALDLSRAQADPSVYANDARGLATAHQLDFLDLVAGDGTLISSAQWPARSGYKNDWVTGGHDWNHRGAFLQRVDLPDGVELGLLAVRTVTVGEKRLYLIGGLRFDREFLRAVALPAGTRALLYSHLESAFVPESLASADGPIDQPERFAGILDAAQKSSGPSQQSIQWTADRASAENFVAIPLLGRQNEPLGVVLLGSAQREQVTLENSILISALALAALGLLAGILLSGWAAARATKPLVQVTAGVRQVTAGNWAARVELRSREEAGQLAQAFNEMTTQISRERARLVQTERVAAWRDVSQRMTQEVKQYLFPIEVTVGGLTRARAEASPRFGEVLNESLAALRAEMDQLKVAVNRFSEFAKMPQPRCKPVDVNEILRAVLQAFEPQFRALGRPPVTPELLLDGKIGRILADPDLLRKAFENLLLHSIDTMPSGGTLTVRTAESSGIVRIQVSGSGAGFGTEQWSDPFTAFRARQTPGAALGLPTVQAVVSDHGGRFFAETVPGMGTTFYLEFAVTAEVAAPPAMHLETPRRAVKHEPREIPEALLESIPAVALATQQPVETPAAAISPTSPILSPALPLPVVVPPASTPPVDTPVPVAPFASKQPVETPAPVVSPVLSPAPPSPVVVPLASTPPVDTPALAALFAESPVAGSSAAVLSPPAGVIHVPPSAESKSESPEVPAPSLAPTPALETISPALPAPPSQPRSAEKSATRRPSRRALLPSLLGLDLLPREDVDDSAEMSHAALQTVPPEPLPPPTVVPGDAPSLKRD